MIVLPLPTSPLYIDNGSRPHRISPIWNNLKRVSVGCIGTPYRRLVLEDPKVYGYPSKLAVVGDERLFLRLSKKLVFNPNLNK